MMAIYTVLTEAQLEAHVDKADFISNNLYDTAKNPKRVMFRFDGSLPASLSSYESYTESEVQKMHSDSSSDWYLRH